MENIYQEYIEELANYLNLQDNFESEESVIGEGLEGNVTVDEVRASEQCLLYLIIDQSFSIYNNGTEKDIKKGLRYFNDLITTKEHLKDVQTAISLFGSTLDMRPFQYGDKLNTSYEAKETKTRLYDAVIESCRNMLYQYSTLQPICKLKGAMFIFTDGEDNGSSHTMEEVHYYLSELVKNNIVYLVVASQGADLKQLARDFETEPICIEDTYKLKKLLRFTS